MSEDEGTPPRRRFWVVSRRDWIGQYDPEDVVVAEDAVAAAQWDPQLWRGRP